MSAGIQGWQPPQQQQQFYGGQQQYGQQQQAQQQQEWNPNAGHSSTMGHNDYPSPGEIHLTMKQYITRLALSLLIGIIIGGIIMFRLFPIFVRVVQATADSAGGFIIGPILRLLIPW